MSRRRVKIDEAAFAGDFASGMYTQAELAAMYGLSKSAVEKIVHGRRRPEVRGMIAEARAAAVGTAQERLRELLWPAMRVLAAAMEGGASWRAFSAAKVVLDRVLGRPERKGAKGRRAGGAGAGTNAGNAPQPALDMTGLPPELRREVCLALGRTEEQVAQGEREIEHLVKKQGVGTDGRRRPAEQPEAERYSTGGRASGAAGACGFAAGGRAGGQPAPSRPGEPTAAQAGGAGGCKAAERARPPEQPAAPTAQRAETAEKTEKAAGEATAGPPGERPMPRLPAGPPDRWGNPQEQWRPSELAMRQAGWDMESPAGAPAGNVRAPAGEKPAAEDGTCRNGRDLGNADPPGRGAKKRCGADKSRTMAGGERRTRRGKRPGGKPGVSSCSRPAPGRSGSDSP